MKNFTPFNPLQVYKNSGTRFIKLSLCVLLVIIFVLPANSQDTTRTEKKKRPSWWIGVAAGANFNKYKGSFQQVSRYGVISVSPAFTEGNATGGYLAGVVEFRPENSSFGFILKAGADNRQGVFTSSGNKLDAEISYFSIEPSLLLAPGKGGFYLYAGPRLGFLWSTGFTLERPNQPRFPSKEGDEAYLWYFEKFKFSLQFGAGYNIVISRDKEKREKMILSPFITYLPSFGNIRNLENLKLNTIRTGLMWKIGLH